MARDEAGQAADKLQRMLTGSWVAQAIYAAAKLGIAELLRGGPKSAAELAQATGTHEESLYRLLRMLVSLGMFKRDGRSFSLNALGETLLPDVPHSKWAMAVMFGEEHYRAWGELVYSLQTGQPAFDHVYGEGIFDFLQKHPEQAKIFDAAMTAVHGRESAAMIEAYDFSQFHTVVDIGGSTGGLISLVLKQHPQLRGILFDLPQVVQRSRDVLSAAGLSERCQTIGGSFFASVPTGGDLYMMRHIIHDWDDQRCQKILSHCRQALAPGGKVLVIEMVIPENDEPGFGQLLDLNMLVMPGGKERTASEYEALFAASGLKLTQMIPTSADVHLIEGTVA